MVTEAHANDERGGGGEDATARDGDLSPFALDVYWASGGGSDTSIGRHVTGCARCSAYLAKLDAIDEEAPPRVRPPGRRRWTLTVAGGLTLAAAIALFVRGKAADRAERDAYVGAKGTPAVQLIVHRDRDTWIWDARSPIRAGDALALRVACEGMKRVVVTAPSAPGERTWARLSDGTCPAHDEPLPFTLQVDHEPGDERFAVVLSHDALDDETLRSAVTEGRRTTDTWVVSFVMPKETETTQ
jgi:hypothetical protein